MKMCENRIMKESYLPLDFYCFYMLLPLLPVLSSWIFSRLYCSGVVHVHTFSQWVDGFHPRPFGLHNILHLCLLFTFFDCGSSQSVSLLSHMEGIPRLCRHLMASDLGHDVNSELTNPQFLISLGVRKCKQKVHL